MSKQSDIVKVSQGAAGDPLYVDSTNNRVGIGTSSPKTELNIAANNSGQGAKLTIENTDTSITTNDIIGQIDFYANDGSTNGTGAKVNIKAIATSTAGTATALTFGTSDSASAAAVEAARIDASGNLLVGKTALSSSTDGFQFTVGSAAWAAMTNSSASSTDELLLLNRTGNSGEFIQFKRDTATVGYIQSWYDVGISIGSGAVGGAGVLFSASDLSVYPARNSSGNLVAADNQIDLGSSGYRYDDVYATNGTIQTSDRNEKQQIAELTVAEITAARAISKLFKTFKWNSSVEEKGEAARIHSGVIAQDVEQAMTDAGLDAGKYAFFISSTWWELDGQTYENAEEAPEGAVEKNRKGIRYPQLLSFVGAATEQRLASIESRLDALEGN